MATTNAAVDSGGSTLALVVAIEGYPYLLTNWHDASAVVTAWSGTDWSQVIRGLEVIGEFSQEIRPLDPQFDFGTVELRIVPDADDQLGLDVWSAQRNTGQRTLLDADLDPSDTSATVIAPLSAWTGSRAYLGTESVAHSGVSSTSVTITSRGDYSPFETSTGAGFARSHVVNETAGAKLYRPFLTDWKRTWVGSHVAIYLHAGAGGDALNAKADARLIFAGSIADLADLEDGSTSLTCVDIREDVGQRLLLANQYSAEPVEGFYVGSGEQFYVYGQSAGSVSAGENMFVDIASGVRTVESIVSEINDEISSTAFDVTVRVNASGQLVTTLTLKSPTGTSWLHLQVAATPRLASNLGIEVAPNYADLYPGTLAFGGSTFTAKAADPTATLALPLPVAYVTPAIAFGGTIEVASVSGEFVPQGDSMPTIVRVLFGTDDGGDWGFLSFNDQPFLVKKTSDTEFTCYWDEKLVYPLLGATGERKEATVVRRGQTIPRYRQVVLLEENIGELVPKLLASTGDAAYNHPTYDALDRQLGAGIPWSLLGDTFLESVGDLAEAVDGVVTLYLDRPTLLREILTPELALRNAHLVFREGLVFRRASADIGTPDHTLTDANLRGDPQSYPDARPVVAWSRNSIINSLKIEYNRTTEDKYLDSVEVRNDTSIAEHNSTQPITIKARNNHYRGSEPDSATIYRALEQLASEVLAVYDEPLRVVSMPIDGATVYSMAPGDTVALTSSFVRSPASGARSASGLLGYVLRASWDFTAMTGDVDILLTGAEEARAAAFSPIAQLDETYNVGTFTAGYDSFNEQIRLKRHAFTGASEQADALFFAENDPVTIVEKSPANPASPQSWNNVVSGIDADFMDLDSTLTGFDATKEYYVISREYPQASTARQAEAFNADDADDHINDAVRSRTWRTGLPYDFDRIDVKAMTGSTTDLHEYPPTDGSWWQESEPLHPAVIQASAASVNNLCFQRSVLASAWWFPPDGEQTSSAVYTAIVPPFPVFVSPATNKKQTLTCGVHAFVSAASTGSIRITSWRAPPSAPTDFADIDFQDQPVRSVEFTTTSTTGTNIATQTIDLNVNAEGITWLTVQAKNSAAANTQVLGFHTWYVSITA